MKDDAFKQHCTGLNQMLENNQVTGFYFFINDIKSKDKTIASLSGNNLPGLPDIFKDIFILLYCLNSDNISKRNKVMATEVLDKITTILGKDIRDSDNNPFKKGESNG